MPRSRDGIMRQVLTVAQMRAAEDDLISAGTSVDALMQQAGRGAGEWVRRIAGGGSVTVLCGPGNNGGDGWVIAEYLREHGNAVRVIAAREPATEAARTAKSLYSGEVRNADADVSGDVFVDCLFGSGLTRVLPEDLAALLDRLAAGHRHRIEIVDIGDHRRLLVHHAIDDAQAHLSRVTIGGDLVKIEWCNGPRDMRTQFGVVDLDVAGEFHRSRRNADG
ncbi:MAG: hypothetical protein B7Y31_07110 [Novosphingobium sp. 16-62-11]|nr:MAG: hypothetical protein B7Y31_07110 [Novosphingobium sp. 16-62-11]